MKVALIALGPTGMLEYALNLYYHLTKTGVDFLLFTTEKGKSELINEDINCHLISNKNIKHILSTIKEIEAIKSVLETFMPNFIHITSNHYMLPLFCYFLKRRNKLIYTMHDCNSHLWGGSFIKRMKAKVAFNYFSMKYVLKSVSEIITLSSYVSGQVLIKYKRNTKIIYLTNFQHTYEKIASTTDYNIYNKDYINVFVFGLSLYKGSRLILEALKFIKSTGQFNKIKFIIAGNLFDTDTLYDIEQLIKDENGFDIKNNVTIITYPIDVIKVDYMYRNADIIALPYIEVSQSGVLAIAVSYNKKIVVSNLGSFVEYKLLYPQNIFVFNVFDKICFLKKIKEAADSTDVIYINGNDISESIAKQYVELYKGVDDKRLRIKNDT